MGPNDNTVVWADGCHWLPSCSQQPKKKVVKTSNQYNTVISNRKRRKGKKDSPWAVTTLRDLTLNP